MPYIIYFKNKYSKGWVTQTHTHATKAGAKRTAEYIKNQHDPEGRLVRTQVRIKKVKKSR